MGNFIVGLKDKTKKIVKLLTQKTYLKPLNMPSIMKAPHQNPPVSIPKTKTLKLLLSHTSKETPLNQLQPKHLCLPTLKRILTSPSLLLQPEEMREWLRAFVFPVMRNNPWVINARLPKILW